MSFSVSSIKVLAAGAGELGICPIPGRWGGYRADMLAIAGWGPGLVLSLTTGAELAQAGAAGLADDLRRFGCAWRHMPVADFAAPEKAILREWSTVSAGARAVLAARGRVLVHCRGGCGRSGMAALRLLVEMGEGAEPALARLRMVRPCAVETQAQFEWASQPQNQSGKA